MYLVGAAHPNKEEARSLVEASIDAGEQLVTDVEVYQEILHRYVAINRRDAITPAFDALGAVVDVVFPIELEDVERARRLISTVSVLSARDAIHIAVMQHHNIPTVLTF